MDYEKFIIDTITKLSGKYTPYQIFTDWIRMLAIAIQNSCQPIHDKLYKDREDQYITTAKKYSSEEIKMLCDMAGAGCGSRQTGQFFTPYHLSYLSANLVIESQFDQIVKNDHIELNEPSTGGGGFLIAFAQVLKEKGIDYQRKLHVVAQDLDWNGVYMTYIQMSLLGVKAIVVQGDTLRDPYRKG